jgi:serine/threonine-protein kinase
MKICATCQRAYEDDAMFCLHDGTPLLAADPLVGQVLDGRYELLARLGAGSDGTLYKARHVSLKTTHAIKLIRPELAGNTLNLPTRFRQGATAVAAIRHPNVIAVTDFGVLNETTPYLVMEFVSGRSLHDLLAAEKRLPPAIALELMSSIGAGVEAAHQHGIIHGDLKPQNVWLAHKRPLGESVKVLGFGLAAIRSAALTGSHAATDTDAHTASLYYMAPERWSVEQPDARADLYSLGVILYQMLAGDVPFKGPTTRAVMQAHLTQAPPSFADLGVSVPTQVETVVRRALEKQPSRRPPTVAAFIEALRATLPPRSMQDTGSFEDTGSFLDVPLELGSVAPPISDAPGQQEEAHGDEDAPLFKGSKSRVKFRGIPLDEPAEEAAEANPADEPPLYADENVQFTVYRPEVVAPARWYTLLAFAHLSERRADAAPDEPDPLAEVERIAARVLADEPASYKPVRQDSLQAIPRKGEITFVPFVAGCEFNPPSQSFFWQKSVHKVEFEMRAAATLDGRMARGRMSVFLGSLLVADVPLAMRVDSAHRESAKTQPPLPASARPYRKIFASYSHRDREIVEQIEHHIQVLGDKYLRDVTELRAGQDWQRWMREAIQEADVFQLFWSHNAMRSTYVRQEWEYALTLARPNFVRPIYWETPLPESPADNLPPEDLRRLHFQHLRPGVATHPTHAPPAAPPPAPAPTPQVQPPPQIKTHPILAAKASPAPTHQPASQPRADMHTEKYVPLPMVQPQSQSPPAESPTRPALFGIGVGLLLVGVLMLLVYLLLRFL